MCVCACVCVCLRRRLTSFFFLSAEREAYGMGMAYGYPPAVQSSYEEAFHLAEEATHSLRHRSSAHQSRHYPRGYERDACDPAEDHRPYRSEAEVSASL